VLEDINFSVAPGEGVAILGPSGCGKSTLLHIIAGLLSIESGELYYGEQSMKSRPGWISYMQQDDLLLPWKSIAENIALPLIIQGTKKAAALEQVRRQIADFGLQGFEDLYPSQLSGGMRQRAAFMRSCMLRQDVLLLDEPFSRLDYLTRSSMYSWFQQYLAQHSPAFVLVTHDPDEALLLCDRVIVLSSRPARVEDIIDVPGQRPRSSDFISEPEVNRLRKRIIAKAL